VQQRNLETLGRQEREEVLPVVPGGLHRAQGFLRAAQQRAELRVALRILRKRSRLHEHASSLVDDGHHVALRADVDANESHLSPWSVPPLSGASEPSFIPTLVHARTMERAIPQDTVRVRKLGRGRLSQNRGSDPKDLTATLSRNCVPWDPSPGLSGMCW